MYSNNILNVQESTIILNAETKNFWKHIEGTTYIGMSFLAYGNKEEGWYQRINV